MAMELQKLIDIKDAISKEFVGKSIFLHGVAVGFIEPSNEIGIRFYVHDENGRNEVRNLLQPRLRSILSEIIVCKPISFCSSSNTVPTITAGTNIGNHKSQTKNGTIGYFCTSNVSGESGTYILSCNHVLASTDIEGVLNDNYFDDLDIATKEFVYQPSRAIAPMSAPKAILHRVKELKEFVPNNNNSVNFVDAAIAKLNVDLESSVNLNIKKIGQVSGSKSFLPFPTLLKSLRFQKMGIATALTYGKIYDISADFKFAFSYSKGSKNLKFVNTFKIKPDNIKSENKNKFADDGDSGALVVNVPLSSNPNWNKIYAVGLLFGKHIQTDSDQIQRNYGIVNPISYILKELEITLL